MISNLPTRIFRALLRRPDPARRRRPFIGAEFLESRVLLSAITGSDIAGTWVFSGSAQSGTIQFDDSSHVTGGSLTDSSGTTTTPAGSYSLASDGSLLVNLNSGSSAGAMNGRHDVLALTETTSINSLALLVNSGDAAFSDADLKGTWTLAFANNADTHSGGDIVNFNGNGGISGGSLVTGQATSSITGGSYILSSDGACSVTIMVKTGSATTSFSFNGAINASDDVLAISATNLDTANQTGKPNLVMLVKSGGAYSKASLTGAWTFNTELGVGTLNFSGGGAITGGTFTDYQGNLITISSGNYTMSSDGAMLVFVQYDDNGTNSGAFFRGAMNASDNLMVGDSIFDTPFGNVAAFVSAADHAPTLTSEKPFATAVGNSPFNITYAQLTSNAVGLNDIDDDTLDFQVDFGAVGTSFAVNGVTQNSFPFDVAPGQTLSVTLPADASGKVDAFKVNAFDGTLTSAVDVPVVISTIPEPTVSVVTTVGIGDEVNNGVKGIGKITFTRTGSTELPLDVNYSVSGAANDDTNYNSLSLLAIIPHGQSSITVQVIPKDNLTRGGTSVALTLGANGTAYNLGAKDSGTVTIVDNNFAPLSIAGESLSGKITAGRAPFAGAGTYQLFLNATSNAYVFVGGTGLDSTMGTYTYQRTAEGAAALDLTGTNGTADGTLTMSSATAGVFSFAANSGTGSQTSKVTLVAAPKTDFSPGAIPATGLADKHKIISATGDVLPRSGSDESIFSESSDKLVIVGNSPVPSGLDHYVYEKFGPDLAIATFTNSLSINGFTTLLYTAATKGTYTTTLDGGRGSQHGSFTVVPQSQTVIAPASLEGETIHNAITGGKAAFAVKGTSTLLFSGTSASYTFTQTTPTGSSTGTYTYERLTPTIGYVLFDDSLLGDGSDVLLFTSPTKATYVFAQAGTLAWQKGNATLL